MIVRIRHRAPSPGRPFPDAPRRERGTVLVVTMITLSSLLVVSTLIIDGSQAYPQRRRAQNAADEAALAATRALDRWKIAKVVGTAGGDVRSTALTVVQANGAQLAECTLIRGDGTEIGPCDSSAALGTATAAGVKVVATETRPTTFGAFVNKTEITARATAKATSQPLPTAGSPFVACGNKQYANDHPKDDPIDLLTADATAVDPVKVAALAAAGTDFILQGSKVNPCGGSSSFKGKTAFPDSVTNGAWNEVDPGNGYEPHIEHQVLGATPCAAPPYENCDILVPVASQGRTSPRSMLVVGWVVFHVRQGANGNEKYIGKVVGTRPYVAGGATSNGTPAGGDVRVIRLIA